MQRKFFQLLSPDEIPSTEVPPAAPVPPANPPAEVPAPPPAAELITYGEVKDERQLALDRRQRELDEREGRLRDVETKVSERERTIQQREEALRVPPEQKPVKVKRRRNFTDPVICEEEIEVD